MSKNTKNKKLFDEFPGVSAQEWENQLIKDLKGADYTKTLFKNTREGILLHPFYRSEDLQKSQLADLLPGQFPFLRGKNESNSWLIRQDIIVDNIASANKKAIELAAKGVNSIGFLFSNQIELSVKDIENLMENIHSEESEVNFLCGTASHKILSIYQELVEKYQRNPEKIYGSVDFDPFMAFTFRGRFCQTEEYAFTHAKQLVYASKELPNFKVLAVHGFNLRNAGATIVQELAFSLAQAVEYIDKLSNQGLTADKIASRIKFNFGVGSNYFMEIAKLRAARYLWSKALSAFEIINPESAKMSVHSVSVLWNKSTYDPYVNVLRTSTEAMSAIIGGTDSLCLTPFNMTYQMPNEFSERIARNQQLLLKEESFLDKVTDVSAGSYFIENLTFELIQNAWDLFIEVEEKGGYIAALRQGFVQDSIEKEAEKSKLAMATRREIVLGNNQYPDTAESYTEMLNPDIFEDLDLTLPNSEIKTLKQSRLSQSIEQIRHKTDRYAQKNQRPKVFMLPLGNKSMSKIRAQFACNYFACGGFEVEDNNGFESVAEAVEAAKEAKADIFVICSSDIEYPALAEAVYHELRHHALLVIAGFPKEYVEEITAIGINHFIHAKSNIVEDLNAYQYELGID